MPMGRWTFTPHVTGDLFTGYIDLLLRHTWNVSLVFQPGEQVGQSLLPCRMGDRHGVEVDRLQPVEEDYSVSPPEVQANHMQGWIHVPMMPQDRTLMPPTARSCR
jgi:hypothetical protein